MNRYRFPIWFRIYPDENIVSWLEALFSVNGMSKKAFSVTLEGSTELLELENICRKYEGDKFPTLEEIMSRHSEFCTMMPFRNESMNVLVAEQVIRQAEDFHMIPGNKKNHCKVLRCCPECLAEDMANGRRPYIRAWHSLHGVTACAKHGCRLQIYSIYDSDKPVVPADEESLRYAKFLYQVYLHQPKVTLDDIKDLLAGTKTGRLILDRLTINCIIKAFCEKYEPDEFIEQIKGREKEGCQIASNTCPHCGTIYHSFGLARSYGYECPICERKYDGLELLQKRIDLSWNEEYEVTGYEDEAHVRIRHRPCGREYILPLNARGLTKRQLCDKCNYKYRDRIGRKATMNSGETCRIIAYRSSMDLDVEFEDGAIAKHTTYTNFKLGMIGRPDDTPEEQAKRRLGEKRTMNCGLEAEIIRYGAYADIDVRFEDGYIARHAAYKEFLNGSIRPPIDRVGETGIMNNGLKATIIAYRKHIDMDVLFEDGSVAEHIDYSNFDWIAISIMPYNGNFVYWAEICICVFFTNQCARSCCIKFYAAKIITDIRWDNFFSGTIFERSGCEQSKRRIDCINLSLILWIFSKVFTEEISMFFEIYLSFFRVFKNYLKRVLIFKISRYESNTCCFCFKACNID